MRSHKIARAIYPPHHDTNTGPPLLDTGVHIDSRRSPVGLLFAHCSISHSMHAHTSLFSDTPHVPTTTRCAEEPAAGAYTYSWVSLVTTSTICRMPHNMYPPLLLLFVLRRFAEPCVDH
jgi:hypothetical protein